MKLLALAGACFALNALGVAQDAREVIGKAVRSQPQLRYKGTRMVDVVVGGRPVHLTEYVSRDRGRSRTTYPDDSPRRGFVIVETPGESWEYNPGRNTIRRLPGRRPDHMMLRELLGAMANGRLSAQLDGPETVAGRRTSKVSISDRGGNTIRRLWIDATGMILRTEQYGPGGRKLAGFAFTSIDMDPKFAPNEFARPGPKDARVLDRPPEFGVPWKVRIPTWLPPNFSEVGRGLRRLPGGPVVMLHFSDGRKNFTVFQGDSPVPPDMTRGEDKPGLQTASRMLDGLWFVGIGRVEKATLERVLKSIK